MLTPTLTEATQTFSYVPPVTQAIDVHASASADSFIQRVIDVAGPSPDVVEVMTAPTVASRPDPDAHNITRAASVRDNRVEPPAADPEERRRRKWQSEYEDWVLYCPREGPLTDQLRSFRRTGDFNLAGSRVVQNLQIQEELANTELDGEMESLASLFGCGRARAGCKTSRIPPCETLESKCF